MNTRLSVIAVTILGALALLSLLLIGLLALRGQETPDILIATVSGSTTGLLGLLVPRPSDTGDVEG